MVTIYQHHKVSTRARIVSVPVVDEGGGGCELGGVMGRNIITGLTGHHLSPSSSKSGSLGDGRCLSFTLSEAEEFYVRKLSENISFLPVNP